MQSSHFIFTWLFVNPTVKIKGLCMSVQSKTVDTDISTKDNVVNNPSWREDAQLAIYIVHYPSCLLTSINKAWDNNPRRNTR